MLTSGINKTMSTTTIMMTMMMLMLAD